ncbi:hypothetical protein IQ22_01896 [Pseudomonas duriflava]|uniref:Lipoprotein n=1 Tax=Pseudomonas duriflava TaxID=459528 RepID=A0A562QDZ0_9PSED|nr:hypothetical protein [Pseudomonas duriflava]TWI54985.1 hypothetical protein IQ22_01896 [Pseudomonas duriflava]
MRSVLAITFAALTLAGLAACGDKTEDYRKEAARHEQKAQEYAAAGNQAAARTELAEAASADHAARVEEAANKKRQSDAETSR